MVTTFTVTFNDVCKKYECEQTHTISRLKEDIIRDYNVTAKYIDIDFKLERPIRTLGMFNLEPGILPRTLDNYTLDRFGIEGMSIEATFSIIENYTPFKKRETSKPLNLKKYKQGEIESGVSIEANYNLESSDDFPSLS
jgi:hypothetical protein